MRLPKDLNKGCLSCRMLWYVLCPDLNAWWLHRRFALDNDLMKMDEDRSEAEHFHFARACQLTAADPA